MGGTQLAQFRAGAPAFRDCTALAPVLGPGFAAVTVLPPLVPLDEAVLGAGCVTGGACLGGLCYGAAQLATWFIDFAVLPEFQGSGIGKELTRRWMAVGLHHLTFCNPMSIAIFKKFGWQKTLGTLVIPKKWPWLTRSTHAGETARNL